MRKNDEWDRCVARKVDGGQMIQVHSGVTHTGYGGQVRKVYGCLTRKGYGVLTSQGIKSNLKRNPAVHFPRYYSVPLKHTPAVHFHH